MLMAKKSAGRVGHPKSESLGQSAREIDLDNTKAANHSIRTAAIPQHFVGSIASVRKTPHKLCDAQMYFASRVAAMCDLNLNLNLRTFWFSILVVFCIMYASILWYYIPVSECEIMYVHVLYFLLIPSNSFYIAILSILYVHRIHPYTIYRWILMILGSSATGHTPILQATFGSGELPALDHSPRHRLSATELFTPDLSDV